MNTLDKFYLSTQIRVGKMKENIKNFIESEKGVSTVVATIIILLIVVIIIGIFWDKLSEWLSEMMNSIFGSDVPSEGDMSVDY